MSNDNQPAFRGRRPVSALGGVMQSTTLPHNFIDCAADPFVPEDWSVEEHHKRGTFKWDPSQVRLYLSKEQQGNNYIVGHKLRKELQGKPVLNANVLDYLLKNPHLIPEEWKGKRVCFWGTIYRSSISGDPYVRYMSWTVRCLSGTPRWHGDFCWLGLVLYNVSPATLRAR
jgi:hypothetical protein